MQLQLRRVASELPDLAEHGVRVGGTMRLDREFECERGLA
jgi:hypothetical protein